MKLAAFATALTLLAGASIACEEGVADLRHGETSVRFQVEIADTPEERAEGLMFRESLPQFAGMLFVYDRPQRVSFWMKNTLIPLDMLFIDQSGTVQRIARETTPLSTEGVPGGDDIQMVLEINGGLSDMLGLKVGSELRHPAVSPDLAAWPCE